MASGKAPVKFEMVANQETPTYIFGVHDRCQRLRQRDARGLSAGGCGRRAKVNGVLQRLRMNCVLRLFYRLAAAVALASVFAAPAPAQTLQRVERSGFGMTRDGLKVELVTLRNARGMSAQIITYGAIIKELEAPDRNGNFTNILLTAGSLEQYQGGFNGAVAVIGRVGTPIANAPFEVDG